MQNLINFIDFVSKQTTEFPFSEYRISFSPRPPVVWDTTDGWWFSVHLSSDTSVPVLNVKAFCWQTIIFVTNRLLINRNMCDSKNKLKIKYSLLNNFHFPMCKNCIEHKIPISYSKISQMPIN